MTLWIIWLSKSVWVPNPFRLTDEIDNNISTLGQLRRFDWSYPRHRISSYQPRNNRSLDQHHLLYRCSLLGVFVAPLLVIPLLWTFCVVHLLMTHLHCFSRCLCWRLRPWPLAKPFTQPVCSLLVYRFVWWIRLCLVMKWSQQLLQCIVAIAQKQIVKIVVAPIVWILVPFR